MAFKLGQKPGNPVINAQNNNHDLIQSSNISMMNINSPQYQATLNTEPDASSVVGTNPREQLNKQLGIPKNTPPNANVQSIKDNVNTWKSSQAKEKARWNALTDDQKSAEQDKKLAEQQQVDHDLYKKNFYAGYGGITTGAANIALGSGEEGEVAGGFVPGVGEVIDAKNTIKDLKKGDYAGAVMNAAGFMLPFVPGKAIKKLFGKADGPVPAPKPMPTSNPIKEIQEQANDRFATGTRKYGNEPSDGYSISENELNIMKQQGKDLDDNFGYFDYSGITPENAKFHGLEGGRPIAEVELPSGKTQMMYKSSGLAGKAGDGVGGTTEGLWQPYGGHVNMPNEAFGKTDGGVNKDWFIKDSGYKDYYGSTSFKKIASEMDRLAQEGNWDITQMARASSK